MVLFPNGISVSLPRLSNLKTVERALFSFKSQAFNGLLTIGYRTGRERQYVHALGVWLARVRPNSETLD
jgi:hypothetical protein